MLPYHPRHPRGTTRRSSSLSGLRTWVGRFRWRRQRRRALSRGRNRSPLGASASAGCAGSRVGFARFASYVYFSYVVLFIWQVVAPHRTGSEVSTLNGQGGHDIRNDHEHILPVGKEEEGNSPWAVSVMVLLAIALAL